MSRHVLVLGASGFLGRRVIAALAAATDFNPVAAWHRRPLAVVPGIAQLQLDACDRVALAGALAQVDAVVNCVAGSADTIVKSGQALFAAAAAVAAPPRIVHLSSMAVYGSQVGTVTEDAALLADVGAYATAKLAVEQAAATYSNRVILRPGCIYGPGSSQWSTRIAQLLQARRIGDLGAGGDGYSNLVHVDDVVAAVLAGLRLTEIAGRAYNLAAAPQLRWNEYFGVYAKALGAVPLARISRRRLQVESKLLAPGFKIGSMVAQRLPLLRRWVPEPIPPSLARLWAQEIRLDATRAERELGIVWTPLSSGLAETVTWLRRVGSTSAGS